MIWAAQSAEGFRKRALEGIKVITYLEEFANVTQLSELSELFQDDNRLAEAAVGRLSKIQSVRSEVSELYVPHN